MRSAVWSCKTYLLILVSKLTLETPFNDEFTKQPYLPEVCTGAVLLSFLSNRGGFRYGVVTNYSYKVIQHQIC